MSKQCLDKEQIKHLIDLNVDFGNNSMMLCWLNKNDDSIRLLPNDDKIMDKCDIQGLFPTFTLSEMFNLVPNVVVINDKMCWLEVFAGDYIKDSDFTYFVCYHGTNGDKSTNKSIHGKELIDCLYEMLCWIIENNIIVYGSEEYEKFLEKEYNKYNSQDEK